MMQAESLDVLEKADLAPRQARAIEERLKLVDESLRGGILEAAG
jgi:hypothetical protein